MVNVQVEEKKTESDALLEKLVRLYKDGMNTKLWIGSVDDRTKEEVEAQATTSEWNDYIYKAGTEAQDAAYNAVPEPDYPEEYKTLRKQQNTRRDEELKNNARLKAVDQFLDFNRPAKQGRIYGIYPVYSKALHLREGILNKLQSRLRNRRDLLERERYDLMGAVNHKSRRGTIVYRLAEARREQLHREGDLARKATENALRALPEYKQAVKRSQDAVDAINKRRAEKFDEYLKHVDAVLGEFKLIEEEVRDV